MLLRTAIPSKDSRKVFISRLKDNPKKWVLRKVNNFSVIDDSTTVDMSRFWRNFKSLMTGCQ